MRKFLDFFKVQEEKVFINELHEKFKEYFKDETEENLILYSCLTGLLARVAYVDFQISTEEKDHIIDSISHWTGINAQKAEVLANVAQEEMTKLSGLDTRKYCTPLVEYFDIDKRFEIIEILFSLAASDGEVTNDESNEISYIAKALNLENKYFISARAQVKEYLASLK